MKFCPLLDANPSPNFWRFTGYEFLGRNNLLAIYRVAHKYLNPWHSIYTNWDMPIKFSIAFSIDKMNISWKFEDYRCNIKKNIKPLFSWFYYRFLGACIWYLDVTKAKGHKITMVKATKKFFICGKNCNIREHFL